MDNRRVAGNQQPEAPKESKEKKTVLNSKDGYITHSFNTRLESTGNSSCQKFTGEGKSLRYTL